MTPRAQQIAQALVHAGYAQMSLPELAEWVRKNEAQLREPLREFAVAMEAELQDNDHKSHWKWCSRKWLLNRLKEETGELQRALEKDASAEDIIEEAADVANFAMMIADNTTRKEKAR